MGLVFRGFRRRDLCVISDAAEAGRSEIEELKAERYEGEIPSPTQGFNPVTNKDLNLLLK